ncbi:hypothetical protein EMCRGX_G025850 [Ephydatia muelleri]
MNQPQQQNQIFIQQPGLTVQRSQIFSPSEMDLYRQQQQQQLLRQQRMLQMRQQQQQQQQQQQYQFRSQMRMVAPQSATPVQLQQQLMGQQGGFPAALGQGQQQQPPPPHQQGMMMRQQPAGQFTGPQQTAPGFMPGRITAPGFMVWSAPTTQQGDPLGPLLFCLVLQKVVSESIETDFTIIQELGPPLGLFVNPRKCELSSLADRSKFPIEMKRSNVPHLDNQKVLPSDNGVVRSTIVRRISSENGTKPLDGLLKS